MLPDVETSFLRGVFRALDSAQSTRTKTGPLFSGMMHHASGSYVGAFATAAVLLVIAIPTVLLVNKPALSTGDC